MDRSEFFRYPKDSDIIKSLIREAFLRGEKCNSLIIGVGNMEEPLSFLALAQQVANGEGKSLEELIDLEIVEIRPLDQIQPEYGLGKIYGGGAGISKAFLTEETLAQYQERPRLPNPEYADIFAYNDQSQEYQFSDEIIAFLQKITADEAKGHFGTAVEDFVLEDRLQHDLVVCNNVFQHIGGISQYKSPFRDRGLPTEQYATFLSVVRGVLGKVKPGGTLISHTEGSIANGEDPFAKHGSKEIFSLIDDFDTQFSRIQDSVYIRI